MITVNGYEVPSTPKEWSLLNTHREEVQKFSEQLTEAAIDSLSRTTLKSAFLRIRKAWYRAPNNCGAGDTFVSDIVAKFLKQKYPGWFCWPKHHIYTTCG